MLTDSDYLSLKRSVKGWTAKRLSAYGVYFPLSHGWRKRLLREYEEGAPKRERREIAELQKTGSLSKGSPKAGTVVVVKPRHSEPRWKKIRPNSNDELEDALLAEKHLTARWYDRISGAVPWKSGEREALNVQMDEMAAKVNALITENVVEVFASMPSE